ncbi:hypothetical protein TNCV_4290101 [Trichonephila clavipes]|nr:hypothetical protein TNCV_4290101 [Trichonephila clavipes]
MEVSGSAFIPPALFDRQDGNPCCLGGYTNPFECDNVKTLIESSEFLPVVHSLELAPLDFQGKYYFSSSESFSFVGFDESRNHRRSHTPRMSEWIVDKSRSETITSCCVQCVFIKDNLTQSMPTQSGINIEAILLSLV